MSKKWERARDAPVSTQGCCLNRKDHFRLLSLESLMGTLGLIGEERGFPAQRGKDATLQRAWCLSEETQRQGKKPLVVIEVGIEMPLKGAVGWEEARAHCRLWKCPTSSSGS